MEGDFVRQVYETAGRVDPVAELECMFSLPDQRVSADAENQIKQMVVNVDMIHRMGMIWPCK
jgi:hypothetical protein